MSPTVERTAGTATSSEGFVVTTRPPDGDRYEYHLEVVDEGVLACTQKRFFDGDGSVENLEPEATASVENAVAEYGYGVE